MTNEQAQALAQEWAGEAGGRLCPQLTENELSGLVNEYLAAPEQEPLTDTELINRGCRYTTELMTPQPKAQPAREPLTWRTQAAEWLRAKAATQEAYPQWETRVRALQWLADDLGREEAGLGIDSEITKGGAA